MAFIVLSRTIGHSQQMTPTNFEVTKSKVKITEALNANMSAQYLEQFMSDSHSTWQEDWSWSEDDPYKF